MVVQNSTSLYALLWPEAGIAPVYMCVCLCGAGVCPNRCGPLIIN